MELILNVVPFPRFQDTFENFRFNRMTLGLFLADLVRHTLVGLALGVPLLLAVLWLMGRMGERWWLYVWVVWATMPSSCSRSPHNGYPAGRTPTRRVCPARSADKARSAGTRRVFRTKVSYPAPCEGIFVA